MKATRKKTKSKTSGRKKKVLHVTDFRELFELPDDLRRDRPGPLTYTKSFVTLTAGSKEHDIKHFERLEELKSRPDRHLLRSIFEDVKNWSGKKTIRHRGFLLTTSERPATLEYLAGQLKVAVEDLEKAMPVLEEIGLFEWVSIDVLPTNGQLKGAKKKRKTAGTAGRKSRNRKSTKRKKCEAPDTFGSIRTHPDTSGMKRTALYNSTKHNEEEESNETKNKTDGSGKVKRERNSRQKRGGVNANALESKPKPANNEAPSVPTKPRTSAVGGGARLIEFPAPSRAAFNNRGGPQIIGDVVNGIKHRYSADAKHFGCEIYRALELRFDPTSKRGRRELGSFASVWERAKIRLPPDVLTGLRRRAVLEAKKIARRRSRCANVSAVWCHIFARLVASKCVAARTGLEGCG